MEYKKGFLIAFGELFLKSKGVKDIFQKRLANNLCSFASAQNKKKQDNDFKIISKRERLFLELTEGKSAPKFKKILKNTFGISWFSECFCFNSLEDLLLFIKKNYSDWIGENENYAIKMKSNRQTIEKAAALINRKVNLTRPQKSIFLEERKDCWFLYFKKTKGAGGLPVGASGKVLCLISGGIDSVPAAFLAAKRGGKNIWIHFHSFPLVSNSSIKKVKSMAEIFLNYQPSLKVYFVPLKDVQLEIKAKAPAEYRVLLYRRAMLKIAQEIAKKEGCEALVTGESLGQVSSQTLPNIKITQEAVDIIVLQPLISFDKEEIIGLAKKIKTYDVSIMPQEDCCTLFVPKHQTARGDLKKAKELEKNLDFKKILKQAINKIEVRSY